MSETTQPTPQFGTSRDLVIMAIMEIVFGAIVLCFPDQTSALFNTIIAVVLIVIGGAATFMYLSKKATGPFELVILPVGLTSAMFGIILLITPNLLNAIFGVALAVLLLFSGFCTLQVAIIFAKRKLDRWYLPLIFAAAAVICGVCILISPFESDTAMGIFTGVSTLAGGVLLLVTKYMISKVDKTLAGATNTAPVTAPAPSVVTPNAPAQPTTPPPVGEPVAPQVKQDNP